MNSEQAHIGGFIKRASEYGFSEEEALYLFKEASTRYMREFRESTPAGKQIESVMVPGIGQNNADLIKNNPKGIFYDSHVAPKVNPELSEGLMSGLKKRIESMPRLADHYTGIPEKELEHMLASDHIKYMTTGGIRGTNPHYPKSIAMYPQANIDPISGNVANSRNDAISSLSEKAKRSVESGRSNPLANIERANRKNNLASAERRFTKELEERALNSAKPSSGIKGALGKLKSLLRRK